MLSFEFGLIVPTVIKCLFNVCRQSLPTWRKIIPNYIIFPPIKDFLDVYNVEHLS